MKTFLLCLLILSSSMVRSFASPSPHPAVVIHGVLYTTVMTGTASAALKSQKVNNATILAQLVTTGTFTGLAAKDLDIVFDDTDLIVINKTTSPPTPIYTLATSGTDSSELIYGSEAKRLFISNTEFGYTFHLPSGTTETTSIFLHAVLPHDSIRFSFVGGSTSGSGNQFVGTTHTIKKIYTY